MRAYLGFKETRDACLLCQVQEPLLESREKEEAVRKTYEFRIRPTHAQESRLLATLDACRFVYNWSIEDRKNLWDYAKCSSSFFDQMGYLKILKTKHPFLTEVHAHTLQNALKRSDLSFQAFFRRCKTGEKPGFPRFKGRGWYDSFTFPEWGNGSCFDGKRLFLSKIGRVRVNLHRKISGEIKTCTIKRRADGWYALFSVIETTVLPATQLKNPVGIDVGISTFATLSDGTKIENPRHLIQNERVLAIAQRKVSKRKKGSNRRRKAVQHLKLEHLRISRTRKDFHFKTAKFIVKNYNPIFVEDLNTKGMVRNHCLSKHISDAAWGQFFSILGHSAERANDGVIPVEARGTTQDCSRCGVKVPKKLSDRIHECPHCGLIMDRDLNAAINILKKGWASLSARAASAAS